MKPCPTPGCDGRVTITDDSAYVECIGCGVAAPTHAWAALPRVAPNANTLVNDYRAALLAHRGTNAETMDAVLTARDALLRACVVDAAEVAALRVQRDALEAHNEELGDAIRVALRDGVGPLAEQRDALVRDLAEARVQRDALAEQGKHFCAFNHQKIILGADIACPLCMAEIERDEARVQRDEAVAALAKTAKILNAIDATVLNLVEDMEARRRRAEINAKPPTGLEETSLGYFDGQVEAFGVIVHRLVTDLHPDEIRASAEFCTSERATGVPEAEEPDVPKYCPECDEEMFGTACCGVDFAAPPVAEDAPDPFWVEALQRVLPAGWAWACPNCDALASLGENAHAHVLGTGHEKPTARAVPCLAHLAPVAEDADVKLDTFEGAVRRSERGNFISLEDDVRDARAAVRARMTGGITAEALWDALANAGAGLPTLRIKGERIKFVLVTMDNVHEALSALQGGGK